MKMSIYWNWLINNSILGLLFLHRNTRAETDCLFLRLFTGPRHLYSLTLASSFRRYAAFVIKSTGKHTRFDAFLLVMQIFIIASVKRYILSNFLFCRLQTKWDFVAQTRYTLSPGCDGVYRAGHYQIGCG